MLKIEQFPCFTFNSEHFTQCKFFTAAEVFFFRNNFKLPINANFTILICSMYQTLKIDMGQTYCGSIVNLKKNLLLYPNILFNFVEYPIQVFVLMLVVTIVSNFPFLVMKIFLRLQLVVYSKSLLFNKRKLILKKPIKN